MCYNALDRHIENGRGDQIAIIHDSPVTDTKQTITYKEMYEQVSHFSKYHINFFIFPSSVLLMFNSKKAIKVQFHFYSKIRDNFHYMFVFPFTQFIPF